MKKPVIVINLKTYQQGRDVLKLCKIIEKISRKIILGVQVTDISDIEKSIKNPVYVQHVDFFEPGRNTGYILPEAVKAKNAEGVFLNHSEHKISFENLKKTINRCKKIKLKTMVFAGNVAEAKKIDKLKPDYLIYEPPELVAGKTSVSESKPEIIEKVVRTVKSKVLVGAGVHSNKDVKIAMKLGARGVALSSAVTTAKNPKKVLLELLGKFN
ncbi:triose-phosphate isomerase [Candidatus Pacearchaeota archaeon]|nr:triose-phosphate isomerase [Candidatus Pacearchaeota archaeon]